MKYKLLLGTLIVSVASSSANTLSKLKPVNDSIPLNKHVAITCYDSIGSDLQKVDLKGRVQDESAEPLIGVTVGIKDKPSIGTYTDVEGNFAFQALMTDILIFSYIAFETQEIQVSDFIRKNRPIVMKESNNILCYDVVVTRIYNDDIYRRSPKRITKLPYDRIQTPPVSPVGELYEFKDWLDKNVRYNETMLKDKVEGDVILSFAIDKHGKITNKKVIGKLSPEADAEALRVLSSSEKWTPGEHQGKKIKTTLTMEVNFKTPK